MAAAWNLNAVQREDVLQRITASISGLALSRGQQIADQDARDAAVAIERRAYTAAEVASNTTTGSRPIVETTKAYARYQGVRCRIRAAAAGAGGGQQQLSHVWNACACRKLAELVLDTVANGVTTKANGAAAQGGGAAEVRAIWLLLHTSHSGTCCLTRLTSFRLVQVVDLTGSRDFLTKDSTEEVLKAMLVPGSAVRKVRFL